MERELLCRRCDEPGPPWAIIPGSVEAPCGTCGAAVLVTPVGQREVATGVCPLCIRCLRTRREITALAVPERLGLEIDRHLAMWERRN